MLGLWLCLVGTGGCSVNDTVARLPTRDAGVPPSPPDAGGPPSPLDAGVPPDAGTEACSRPVHWVEDASGREVCGARVASQLFQRALCACGRVTLSAGSSTRLLARPDSGTGASVGVGLGLVANDSLDVGGTLQVGEEGVTPNARTLSVGEALLCAGPLESDLATVQVAGDAAVAGSIDLDVLRVGGTLTRSPDAGFKVRVPPERIAEGAVGPFAPACACAPALDVGASARHHSEANDNAAQGLLPDAFLDVSDERTQALPCGRFYVRGLRGSGRLTLEVSGLSALFVDGDVELAHLDVRLAEGAQLDLLIRGDLVLTGASRLGAPEVPAHLRVYVGGDRFTLNSLKGSTLAGQFYAPFAPMDPGVPLAVSGALFVQDLAAGGGFAIAYDPRVLALEKNCPD